jgi:hypothetical protein
VSASCPTSTALDGTTCTLEMCSSGWDGSIAAKVACSRLVGVHFNHRFERETFFLPLEFDRKT